MCDQPLDLCFGFGAYIYIVTYDPFVNGLDKLLTVTDVLHFYLNGFTVLLHKVKNIVPEFYQCDLRGKHFGECVLHQQ